jgi:hypothetical protein
MMIQVRRPKEMTQKVWEEKWNRIKLRTHMIAEDIRPAMGPRNYPRNWGEICICLHNTAQLEQLVQGSDARIGRNGNPIAVIDRLIKSIARIDAPEMMTLLEELGVLDNEAEELMSDSHMAEMEQYRVAREQEEAFKERLYRRLLRMRDFLKYGRLEANLEDMPQVNSRMTPIRIRT